MAIPYLIGFYYSKNNLEFVRDKLNSLAAYMETFYPEPVEFSEASPETCLHRFLVNMHNGKHVKRHDQPMQNLTIVLHRNGESNPCGETSIDMIQGLEKMLQEQGRCPLNFGKYQLDALLTRLFYSIMGDEDACFPLDEEGDDDNEEDNDDDALDFYDYCDRGKERTPILPDHSLLVPIYHQEDNNNPPEPSLPCHFHSEHGIRITSLPLLAQLARQARVPELGQEQGVCETTEDATESCTAATELYQRELHLYAVPAGRVFMFAAKHVGETIALPHVQGADPSQPVYLQVLSTQPRIFEVYNFFDRRDSDDLIEGALAETREAYRIKRSSVGASSDNYNMKRTSESGFDTSSPVASKLKRRGVSLLGFDEYTEGFTDGLQILRYNQSTAYNSHLDWMDPNESSEYDLDSYGVGGNRFATILLYLSDLGENDGGETVFPKAQPLTAPNETDKMVCICC